MNGLARHILVSCLIVFFAASVVSAQPKDRKSQNSRFQNLVTSTYKEYAWMTIFAPIQDESTLRPLSQERLSKLKQIFADDLAVAIFNDARRASKTGEVGVLDFDILFDSQDPDARNLLIRTKTPQIVEVCFVDQTERQRCLEFLGTGDKNDTRIRDIRYDQTGRSIRAILKLN